ncbi:hypothetical protein PIB30_030632 [Stylosanthes scabra]|uniref:Uncharacterized protein n=1 Tax=Stylosanthes scabra TaxID=79078 RepID=A0ABU6YBU2_9FABA|nr:hypothetical protein [Stylosanthes scabra]
MDARASGDCPDHATPDCLVPYIHEAGFGGPPQIRPGGVHDHVAGIADVAYHFGLRTDGDPISGCVREFRVWYGTDTRRWPRNIWADVPRLEGKELCGGEDDLAEAESADDSGERGSARCAVTVCSMLHHDDDRGRLVPQQDQQHRVSAVGPVAARL